MKTSLLNPARAAALALMIVAFGCDSAPERHPRSTQTVVLSADHPNPDVSAGIVTAVEFELPAGPQGSAGYAWEIASNNAIVLEQMGPIKPGTPTDPQESPPAKISFYVLQVGKSVMRFVLVRPGDADAVSAAKCEVAVRVTDF
jgi:hypothetical protein